MPTDVRRAIHFALALGLLLGAQSAFAAELAGSRWRPTEVATAPVPERVEVFMQFNPDGSATGKSGCNRFTAAYEVDGSALVFGPLAATRIACPGPVMTFETVFLGALAATQSFERDGTELLLTDETGQVVARLIQSDPD